MEQKEFRELLKRYRLGQASPDEEKLIDAWYEALERDTDRKEPFGEEELEQYYLSAIEDRINRTLSETDQQKRPRAGTAFLWYTVGIAASLLVIIVSFLYVANTNILERFSRTEKEQEPGRWDVLSNTGNNDQRLILPDSSRVILKPKSSIRFLHRFDASTREVYLEGEGFFDVVHRAQQPFLVHAKEVTTKVLGTSFMVRAFQNDQQVVVAVRTGRVSVYTNPDDGSTGKPEVILTPNQEIVYTKDQERISKRIADNPQPLAEAAEEIKRLRFEEAPVKEVFEAIEHLYGVDIVFDEAKFSSCVVTTSVTDGGLYHRLDIITNTIGASYSLDENRIVIGGKGCK